MSSGEQIELEAQLKSLGYSPEDIAKIKAGKPRAELKAGRSDERSADIDRETANPALICFFLTL